MQADSSPVRRRELPLRQQARIVGIVTLAAAVVLALEWGCSHRPRAASAGPDGGPAAATELRLTNAQLATLAIDPVKTARFHSEQIADGKIALNGDTATQVFSPYSGRVVRVIAALGAQVKAGAPLLEVAAAEIVQAQSDLLDARAHHRGAPARGFRIEGRLAAGLAAGASGARGCADGVRDCAQPAAHSRQD